ncbi:substrate-binding periplasmic protein [Niveibacterium microcysteis]|uniref:Transporter substrate-binding domain-containing protein n=1 Tax=Niveibacterium microcysteis TaxID=2811415 RepID=A0ABX7MC31_9RHOO|nr:transporter substrate-binding domain-containing protein [Niveibacterium microcysteis]QSI77057.1 transporter substrate-binding domain-containing protein [Niveibacterium microcysteis]
MKFWSILFALITWAPALVADDTIPVFGDDNYPPVIWADKGEPRGELPRILKLLEPAMGVRFRLELSPWRRAYESAAAGRGGLIGVSLTSERQKLFDFSDPVYGDNINIVVLRGKEFSYHELGDLKGKRLGGQLGASYGEVFDHALQQGEVAVERDTSQVQRLRKLLAGRLDAALIGNGQAGIDATIAADPELQRNRDRFVALDRPLTVDQLYLAFPKSMGATAMLQQFNAALRTIRPLAKR